MFFVAFGNEAVPNNLLYLVYPLVQSLHMLPTLAKHYFLEMLVAVDEYL